MKKYLLVLGIFIFGMNNVKAQFYSNLNFNINDSLKLVASTNSNPSKIDILMNIGERFMWANGDTAIKYFKLAEDIAVLSKDDALLFYAYTRISTTYNQTIGNYPLGLHYATEQLKLGTKLNLNDSLMRNAYYNLTFSYSYLQNKELGLKYLNLTWPSARRTLNTAGANLGNLAKAYFILEKYDSAYYYNKQIIDYLNKRVYEKRWSGGYVVQGDI
jgi:hypothetical protein